MIANFFGKSNPANFIILFLLFLGFYIAAFFSTFSLDSINSEIILNQLSVLGLFVLLFFFFNFILAKNKLTLYNLYGFLFFVLLFGFFPKTMLSQYGVFLNVLILIFLRRVYSLRSKKDILKKIFDSGFWLGILFLLEPFTLVFGILIFVAIALFQKLNFRTLFIPVIGFVIPVFCYFSYCFWFDQIDQFETLFLWYTDYDFQAYQESNLLIPIVFVGIFTLISIIFKTPKAFLIRGNFRKYWTLILINLLVGCALIFFSKNKTGVEFVYVFFPIAIILTNWVEGVKKDFFKNLILGTFILFPIILFII
jgi:hypothetical protein